jgi:hypothetical protein
MSDDESCRRNVLGTVQRNRVALHTSAAPAEIRMSNDRQTKTLLDDLLPVHAHPRRQNRQLVVQVRTNSAQQGQKTAY